MQTVLYDFIYHKHKSVLLNLFKIRLKTGLTTSPRILLNPAFVLLSYFNFFNCISDLQDHQR